MLVCTIHPSIDCNSIFLYLQYRPTYCTVCVVLDMKIEFSLVLCWLVAVQTIQEYHTLRVTELKEQKANSIALSTIYNTLILF